MDPFGIQQRGAEVPICSQAGEPAILQLIRQHLQEVTNPAPEGIGDDCATWTPPAGETLLLTIDPVVHGIHFDNSHPPEAAGTKLLNRNLSDIAAMGGRPGPALLALAMGPDLRLDWLGRFLDGIAEACVRHAVPLAGGDITSAPRNTFTATLTQTGSATRPLTREGAVPGATLWTTGQLGGSLASGRHLHFEPRLAEGQWLAAQDAVLSMTDLSDGLAKDLPGLLPSGTQARLDLPAIPIAPEAPTLQHALADGEDYELLFTLAPERPLPDWPFKTPVRQIGYIAEGQPQGTLVNLADGKTLESSPGYEHFCR